MTIEQELQLSYYQQVADIDAAHHVHLVQDVRDQKFYVKKLLTTYNPEVYRYLRLHPIANTPQILLAVEDGKILTVIEEYIPGDTLEEILDRQGALPEAQVIGITSQLCGILADFHRCDPPIVNRDIKPSNIKLSPDGVVKLLDMNAAKWCSGQSAQDTILLGTQGYAAPEQYGFGPSSPLSDIYSVGVLMNVMRTGQLPNSRMAGGKLGSCIRRCVELSPSGRYQSIVELKAVLDRFAEKPAAPAEPRKWQRYLPPGFRTNNVLRWLFSALGYLFLFYIGKSLEVKNAGALELAINRIGFGIMCLSVVLFNGNYLNVQRCFPLTRNPHRPLRWLGILAVDAALLLFWAAATVLLVGILVG